MSTTMKSVWTIIWILAGFSLQYPKLSLASTGDLGSCAENEYLVNGGTRCHSCPACPAGKTYTRHCGYQKNNQEKIKQTGPTCESCPNNEYKTDKSIYRCLQCTYECAEGREVIHPCNKTHNLKCSKCKRGFYTASDGSCLKCSFCCGSIFEKRYLNAYVQDECVQANMRQCSCRPIRDCVAQSAAQCSTETTVTPSTPSTSRPSTVKTKPSSWEKKPNKSTRTAITPDTNLGENQGTTKTQLASTNENENKLHSGWFVAVVISLALVTVLAFILVKRYKIVKKIKALLRPVREESSCHDNDSITVVTVNERYVSPAKSIITNYAQRMSPEEEAKSQSDSSLQHLALLNRSMDQHLLCTCFQGEEYTAVHTSEDGRSFLDGTGSGEISTDDLRIPRAQSRSDQRRTRKKWPPTRAEMAVNQESLYGGYVEILPNGEADSDCLSTQGNSSGSCSLINDPTNELCAGKIVEIVDLNVKKSEEHSEEPPTSIPVTAGGENTVVIATGQHSGLTRDKFTSSDLATISIEKSKAGTKRRKRQSEKKSKKPLHDVAKDCKDSNEHLRCTCRKCSYRPIFREQQLCHCSDCVPQPEDDLYNIIERRCLREEICKELNKKGVSNWRDLSTYIRIDKEVPSIERENNPAEVVLEKLKTSRPRLNVEDFNEILNKIKRADISRIIMGHHVSCMLCRRNSFDGSLQEIHLISHSDASMMNSTLTLQ